VLKQGSQHQDVSQLYTQINSHEIAFITGKSI